MKKRLKDNKGITLVEMIVAFALVAMFMGSSATMLSAAVNVFRQSVSMSRAQSVSAMVLDDVVGHIGKASSELEYNDHVIAFKNAKGDREVIYVGKDEQELCIHYDEDVNTKRRAVDWKYPERTYMNFKITDMDIQRIQTTDQTLLFEVTISLRNTQTGYEYKTSRIAQCYYSSGELNATKKDIVCTCENAIEIP